jgi:DNA-binding NarL/FixJ family response regulator
MESRSSGIQMDSVLPCLIVEDQVMFLQLLSRLLQDMPCLEIVATATSCREGMQACQQHRPQLMVLDLALPDGDGLQVARFLRMLEPDAKVLVLSAQASSFVCPEELEPMVVGVVDKTATYETLEEVIHSALHPQDGSAHPSRSDPVLVLSLTPRQRQIFSLIGQGHTNKDIARLTGLSVATVETHRKAIARRLGRSGAELVRMAALHGDLLLTPPMQP